MPIQVYSKGQALAMFGDQPNDMLDGIIGAETTIFYGASGVGKGRLLAEIIGAGLNGEEFAGKRWLKSVERVAVVGTDAGAPKEYSAWVERAGAGPEHDDNLHIWAVDHALNDRGWSEMIGGVLGYQPSLVILDSSTEIIQGSYNDDTCVREFWRATAPIRTAGIPLVMVHHVAKPGPESNGRFGKTPMGSALWENYSRNKVNIYERAGQVVMACRPRHAGAWDAHFDEDPQTGRLTFSDSLTAEQKRGKRLVQRQDQLDRDREVADWAVANCQGMNRSQASKAIGEKFNMKDQTVRRNISGKRDYGVYLEVEGTSWRLAA